TGRPVYQTGDTSRPGGGAKLAPPRSVGGGGTALSIPSVQPVKVGPEALMSNSLSTPMIRRYREPRTRWLPAHQKLAGLGCWAANRSHAARARIKRWKRTHPLDPAALGEFAAAVADLVRAWSPVLPPGTALTVPPQGASAPGPYAAESL